MSFRLYRYRANQASGNGEWRYWHTDLDHHDKQYIKDKIDDEYDDGGHLYRGCDVVEVKDVKIVEVEKKKYIESIKAEIRSLRKRIKLLEEE